MIISCFGFIVVSKEFSKARKHGMRRSPFSISFNRRSSERPFFFSMGQVVQEVKNDQKACNKKYDALVVNLSELAREVLELKTNRCQEYAKSAEAVSKVDEISARTKTAERKIEELTAELEKLRSNLRSSDEAVADIECPQVKRFGE